MTTMSNVQDVRALRASDIMEKDIVTIREDATVQEMLDLLVKNGIWGVPVINELDDLVGVVSLTDLAREENDNGLDDSGAFYQDFYPEIGWWGNVPAYTKSSLAQTRVFDLMSYPCITASPVDTVQTLVQRMLKHHIHRIIIARGDKILGVVTATDILRKLA